MLQLLTALPALYVCNGGRGFSAATGNDLSKLVEARAAKDGAKAVVISAKIDSEIALLDAAERGRIPGDPGPEGAGPAEHPDPRGLRPPRHADLLQPPGPKRAAPGPSRWAPPPPQAAGVIHTDFEKGFIRAETIAFADYVALKGEAGAREAGKLRAEGKTYVVKDGRRDELPLQRLMSRVALRQLVEQATRIVVFTGAGMSTESGVPDFRSPGGGVVENEADLLPGLRRERVDAARGLDPRLQPLRRLDRRRNPTPAISPSRASWRAEKASAVITQNVDNLHQDGGGSGRPGHRIARQRQLRHLPRLRPRAMSWPIWRPGSSITASFPSAAGAAGLIKTATISFGQPMPKRADGAGGRGDPGRRSLSGAGLLARGASGGGGFPSWPRRMGPGSSSSTANPRRWTTIADLVLHDEIGPTLIAIAPTNH